MFALLTVLMLSAAPAVGSVAPDFTAVDTEGKTLHLAELLKQGPVIVAFFPKAFTGGCTKELTAYSARNAELEKSGAQVLAISYDDLETMKKFKAQLKASYHFIPDPDGKLVSLFDTKMPVVKMASRNTFVVGPGRKVLKVESGSDAIDPTEAISACSLKAPKP